MFRSMRGRCPKSCLLEVLGSSRLDFVACEPQQGDQSLFTKLDNDQNHDHFQPSDLLATLSLTGSCKLRPSVQCDRNCTL